MTELQNTQEIAANSASIPLKSAETALGDSHHEGVCRFASYQLKNWPFLVSVNYFRRGQGLFFSYRISVYLPPVGEDSMCNLATDDYRLPTFSIVLRGDSAQIKLYFRFHRYVIIEPNRAQY